MRIPQHLNLENAAAPALADGLAHVPLARGGILDALDEANHVPPGQL